MEIEKYIEEFIKINKEHPERLKYFKILIFLGAIAFIVISIILYFVFTPPAGTSF